MSARALGKRRAAVLHVLAAHGRRTVHDVLRLLDRSSEPHGLAEESARAVLVDLEEAGLVEKSVPHLDRAGVLRGTWKITATGRAAICGVSSASQDGETR